MELYNLSRSNVGSRPDFFFAFSILFALCLALLALPSYSLAQDAAEAEAAAAAQDAAKDAALPPGVDNSADPVSGPHLGESSFGREEKTDTDNQIVITKEDIRAMKVVKLHDALNHVPGISASNSSINIHGSTKVRVFVDGTPLNDPTAGHGSINFDLVSLQAVEKIVILKDSGGLRYGQDASAGVILITTTTFGSNKLSGQARVWYGTNETFKTDASATLSKGPWGVTLKGGYERTNGYKINNKSIRKKGGFKIGRSFGEKKSVFLAMDGQMERKGSSGYPESPTPHAKQKGYNYSVTLAGEWGGFQNNLYYNTGMVENKDPTRALDQSLTVAEYGDSLTYSSSLGPVEFTLGTGFQGLKANSKTFGHKSESVYHFFGAGSYKLPFAPLTLGAGLRYNVNSAFENSLNPEATLALRKGIFEAVYKFNRAVNTPTFQQRYNHSSSTIPNPALSIEKVNSQSLSFILTPRENLNFNATLFHNALRGRISYNRPAGNPIGQYQNLGRAVYKGLDLGFSFRINRKAELKGRYTHLIAKDLDLDLYLSGQSRHYATLELLTHPTEKLSAAIKVEYRDRCFTDRQNLAKIDGRTLYSLRAEYEIGKFILFLDAENLADKEYRLADGLLAYPREIMAGVKWSF
jgi:iron complex outermembrane receptor protein